jgi:hypothetical protein
LQRAAHILIECMSTASSRSVREFIGRRFTSKK